ncbi:hypothetical protein D770_20350 [Flammeovirgaceae bacterium 311]|nr:hypothetical protein D770_20350 [Flammeovirgaceae bacterium 311]
MRQGSYQEFINLLEEIANRHPDIKFFHELEEKEVVEGKLRKKVKYPAMMVEYPDLGFADNKGNTDKLSLTGFAILENVPEGNDVRKREVLARTEGIMLDVISYLREERKKARFHVDTNEFKANKVGPEFSDNLYGWRLELRHRSWVDLHFRPAEWNDYDPEKFK